MAYYYLPKLVLTNIPFKSNSLKFQLRFVLKIPTNAHDVNLGKIKSDLFRIILSNQNVENFYFSIKY